MSESESERSENDLVRTQDYIKEIQIKAKTVGGEKCAEEAAAPVNDENPKWTIFDPREKSSRYKVHLG